MTRPPSLPPVSVPRRHQSGFNLVELMIAVTIGLLIAIALIATLLNVSRTNREMAKVNSQIENGRFAIQLLENDIVHAGFWGTYVPDFDNLTTTTVPSDKPTDVPDPCLAYNASNWNTTYKNNIIGIPVQTYTSAPSTCASIVTNKKASTDVLVVRHAETCVPGVGNCTTDTAGKLYFQSSLCAATAQAATSTSITLAANASSTNNYYNGLTIRTTSGTGSGQSRTISAYDGSTKIATVSTAWTTTPDTTTTYTIGAANYVLDTSGFTLRAGDCTTLADKRKFVSHIYYIRDYATTAGDGIPTLVRSQFDPDGPVALAHQTPEALIEGIEGFQVELGIDSLSKTGAAVNYNNAVTWADSTNKVTPTNRGDGIADGDFIHCTTAGVSPCTYDVLTNTVVAKLYVLARSTETTPGYTDTKTYTLGSTTLGPFNDSYQRHVYSTTVRLTNISGRRETPPL